MSRSDAFAEWWKAYPRKVAKKKAKPAWERAVKEIAEEYGVNQAEATDWLLCRTEAFGQSDKGRGYFCPYPTTWLNEGRWDDDPKEWQEREYETPPPAAPDASLAAEMRRAAVVKAMRAEGIQEIEEAEVQARLRKEAESGPSDLQD